MTEEPKIEIKLGANITTGVGQVRTLYVKKTGQLEHRIETIDGPTHNCQMSIIASFVNLMSYSDQELRDLVKRIAKDYALRNIIQVDVNRNRVQKIETTFKDCIINKMDYTSTNGSLMTIILLRNKSL